MVFTLFKKSERLIKAFFFATFLMSIVLLYLYLTRPVCLNNIIDTNDIQSINVINDYTFDPESNKLPKEICLDNARDINDFMGILFNYNYSRTLKPTNSRPVNSNNGAIHIFMNPSKKIANEYMFVDTENNITFGNTNFYYKIDKNHKELFNDLVKWTVQKSNSHYKT